MKNQSQLSYHLLPTEDASRIAIFDGELHTNNDFVPDKLTIPQHLYLTSDAPIKEGDWYYDNRSKVVEQAIDEPNLEWLNATIPSGKRIFRKIIFTTDPKLIADGVPAIDGNTRAKYYERDGESASNELVEVNFLTEFCKRWNENDNKKTRIVPTSVPSTAHFGEELQYKEIEDNQKVDVEKLALEIYPISIIPTTRFEDIKEYDQNKDAREYFIEGFKKCQAIQSKAGDNHIKELISELKETLEKCLPEFSIGIQHSILRASAYLENESITKQPKADIVIECEMEEYTDGNAMYRSHRLFQPRLNKDGQPILIFK